MWETPWQPRRERRCESTGRKIPPVPTRRNGSLSIRTERGHARSDLLVGERDPQQLDLFLVVELASRELDNVVARASEDGA